MTTFDTQALDRWLRVRAEGAARAEGCEVVEVEVRAGGPAWAIAVTVDREGGVSVEQCARVSRALEAALDAEDPLERPYVLEVSSPGLTRPLRRPEDFERFRGRLVRVEMRVPVAGRTSHRGRLAGLTADGQAVRLDAADGGALELPREAMAWARLDFDPRPSGPARRGR